MTFTETFYGYIETTTDTLLIFEACRRGILPKISRRLQEKERSSIRSGTIFVFDERESGIKRWTDGLIWSPSRILGNFLIYRELDGRENIPKRMDVSDRDGFDLTFQKQQPPYSPYASQQPSCEQADRYRERALVGSLTTSYRFKPSGLIKKTMSIVVNGNHLHLISYYNKNDVINNTLPTPSTTASLAHLRISSDMIHRQSFRVSPLLESPLSQIYPINTNDASSRDTQQVKSLPSPSSSPCSTSPNALVNPSSYHPLTKSVHCKCMILLLLLVQLDNGVDVLLHPTLSI
ncbi:Gti1/Pac2 family-domain-containing protein [Halteromyces radiatus]|uniref:Gti1/Pac2 family-domain-containing protein n=1 Tax=Halteromyces radiatus TaxID=101107 RepID=UPI00222084F9|nr:Gti1/Pac2 family-domain-containing protein [Halteromyces radiatus]KAI8093577.1 Gti1/Pac2 family-domain-containing protein [Halteromyces radiatus]